MNIIIFLYLTLWKIVSNGKVMGHDESEREKKSDEFTKNDWYRETDRQTEHRGLFLMVRIICLHHWANLLFESECLKLAVVQQIILDGSSHKTF